MIECLKTTGMSLKDIKVFFNWCEAGDVTIEKRYQLFLEQKKQTEEKIKELEKALELVNYKVEYYKVAMEKGTTTSTDFEEALAMRFLLKEKNEEITSL